jgi:protein tyrosine/serine phosphatase
VAAVTQESPCVNFGRVSAGLYRGAEPDRDCLGHLAALGVRTVVNLRDEKDASEDEQAGVLALGMRYLNLPMSGFDRPSAIEVQRVLTVLGTSENQPVFVHCKRGRDRTGVIVAAYRMTNDGWAADRAVKEAKDFGLAWWQFKMKKFLRDFDGNGAVEH